MCRTLWVAFIVSNTSVFRRNQSWCCCHFALLCVLLFHTVLKFGWNLKFTFFFFFFVLSCIFCLTGALLYHLFICYSSLDNIFFFFFKSITLYYLFGVLSSIYFVWIQNKIMDLKSLGLSNYNLLHESNKVRIRTLHFTGNITFNPD